jgi:hypothetical protein
MEDGSLSRQIAEEKQAAVGIGKCDQDQPRKFNSECLGSCQAFSERTGDCKEPSWCCPGEMTNGWKITGGTGKHCAVKQSESVRVCCSSLLKNGTNVISVVGVFIIYG